MYDELRDLWYEAGGQPGREITPGLWNAIADELAGGRAMTLEFGSGLSTWLFATTGACHTAIETSPRWFHAVSTSPYAGEARVLLRSDWWNVPAPPCFDLILIDGPAGDRSAVVEQLGPLLNPGGVVFVDDTHRIRDRQLAQEVARELGWPMEQSPVEETPGGAKRFARVGPPRTDPTTPRPWGDPPKRYAVPGGRR